MDKYDIKLIRFLSRSQKQVTQFLSKIFSFINFKTVSDRKLAISVLHEILKSESEAGMSVRIWQEWLMRFLYTIDSEEGLALVWYKMRYFDYPWIMNFWKDIITFYMHLLYCNKHINSVSENKAYLHRK